ncbi:MAG: galactose-1-phosphate uridylyltransferase [bacterium]|nr:galactose-1-phosphate uridylyltransferase [bacterium]
MPQLRQNIITGDWVVIAPERAKRPSEFVSASQPTPTSKEKCPFCPANDNYTKNRLAHYETDLVYVIPNKYPAFVEDPTRCSDRSFKVENDFFVAKPSLGGHDVIIVKDHDRPLPKFDHSTWRDLLVMIKKRYEHFDKLCNNDYTMAIYNEKSAAGASIVHPHAQVFSSNIIPNLISRELAECQHYFELNSRSPFDDVISHEQKFEKRIIAENEHYIAFVQYAARFPFETWILPKYQASRFDKISAAQLASLIPVLAKAMTKINLALNEPALNFYIHSAPNSLEEAEYYRWHLEIAPRLGNFGGYEMGSGVVIDVFSPEVAAEYLNGQRQID